MLLCGKGYTCEVGSKDINECYGLLYQGLTFEKNYLKWGKKEMEDVKKAIIVPGTPWEPCSANEFKVKRSNLNHDTMVWFNFIKHSLLPTSHTTNVEKERTMLIVAIFGGKDVDVGRLICREILLCQGKTAGTLFFPCSISDLCVNVGVEMKGEEKSYPVAAFPTVLIEKPKVAAASSDPTMLPQFMLQQRAIWEFQRKQHLWLSSVLSVNLKEPASVEIHTFPNWVVDEEGLNDVLFDEELEEEVEERKEKKGVAEKKRKRSDVMSKKEERAEIKRGKRPVVTPPF